MGLGRVRVAVRESSWEVQQQTLRGLDGFLQPEREAPPQCSERPADGASTTAMMRAETLKGALAGGTMEGVCLV